MCKQIVAFWITSIPDEFEFDIVFPNSSVTDMSWIFETELWLLQQFFNPLFVFQGVWLKFEDFIFIVIGPLNVNFTFNLVQESGRWNNFILYPSFNMVNWIDNVGFLDLDWKHFASTWKHTCIIICTYIYIHIPVQWFFLSYLSLETKFVNQKCVSIFTVSIFMK